MRSTWIYTARRRAFHVKRALSPCAASQLDFAGWALGAGRKDGSKSPRHRRAQRLVSIFSLGFCRRPARQVRLLWLRGAISGRCLSCVRVPQQRRSLSAVNLHPCVSFSAEVATAFIDAFLALQLCLTSRISQQFNAHTFLEQGTSFQVKRGMQRVQDQ